MTRKMCGSSVACVIFVCFLSSCSPADSPSVAAEGPSPGTAYEDPGIKRTSVPRGNCLEVFGTSGGTAYDYCFYSKVKPNCTVPLSDCRNLTNRCAQNTNPPPC